MGQDIVPLGEIQLSLYTSVRVFISPSPCAEPLAQLLLTDTLLGLVQEDAVFHPTPSCVTVQPCMPSPIPPLNSSSALRCALGAGAWWRQAWSCQAGCNPSKCEGQGSPWKRDYGKNHACTSFKFISACRSVEINFQLLHWGCLPD